MPRDFDAERTAIMIDYLRNGRIVGTIVTVVMQACLVYMWWLIYKMWRAGY